MTLTCQNEDLLCGLHFNGPRTTFADLNSWACVILDYADAIREFKTQRQPGRSLDEKVSVRCYFEVRVKFRPCSRGHLVCLTNEEGNILEV